MGSFRLFPSVKHRLGSRTKSVVLATSVAPRFLLPQFNSSSHYSPHLQALVRQCSTISPPYRTTLPRPLQAAHIQTLCCLHRSLSIRSTLDKITAQTSPDVQSSAQSTRLTMAATKAPYKEQDTQEIAQLVRDLADNKSKSKKGIKAKKTTFKIQGSPDGISVDSWKLSDWDYKRPDLPTYARGLFTTRNRRNEPEIAVRGYDKFFNVDEVSETKWVNIHRKTQGPYELTLKENGCIIFISGLEDGTLLVCSKHSTGHRQDIDVSHAGAGDGWIDKQLATIGKTREEFAQHLRERNITAVAELCDDDFEEHILAYGPERAGLYLHGINVNVPEFMTYPSDLVQSFADEWGFRKVGLLKYEDTESVQKFLDGVADSGAHEGRDVEGFVVRCRMSPDPERVPYSDWFFKYKFEEPYLMYRQWRECTKALIAGKPPKIRKHLKITEEYLRFARRQLANDPSLGKNYNQNHGIIKLRDDFLAEKNIKGSDAANMEDDDDGSSIVTRDVVLVPIATIGCGKTTVGVALTHLFDWAIVQNDNIQGKGRPAQMTTQVMRLLVDHPVVISDRNNSERREREQIIQDVKKQHGDARLVALNFAHGDIDEVRRVTRERVLKRGDNHQTIQAASEESKVIGIMENFISRFQPCDPDNLPDAGFDHVIDLDPAQGSRHNVELVVNELRKKYSNLIPSAPTAEEMDEAVKAAIEDYTPLLRHKIADRSSKKDNKKQAQQQAQTPKKPKPLEYMSVSVPAKDVTSKLEAAFKGASAEEQKMYKQLQQTRRVQPLFHVTLMHRASASQHPELWQRYTALHFEHGPSSIDGKLGECDVMLESVVYDDRIMAIVARLVDPEGQWTCINKVAHITIGTRDNSVKPKESNDLLAKWLEKGSGGDTGICERPIEGRPILKGTVRGVLAR